jgi:hypothetical protein
MQMEENDYGDIEPQMTFEEYAQWMRERIAAGEITQEEADKQLEPAEPEESEIPMDEEPDAIIRDN